MAVTADNVQKAYLAYFGRPADPVGLAYWQTQDAATMKAGFAASAEYTALYANMSTTQMVSQVYTNLLGRAADVTGLLYWAGEITAGRQTVSTLVDAMQTNALGDDILTINNRVTYATAFTAALDTVTEINGYSGTSAATAARTAVSSVLHTDASLTTATTALATSVTTVTAAGTAAAVTTYTLTSDAPSITEGDSGTKSLTFTLTLDKAPTEAITVNYQTLTTGTAASGDDFTAAASTVTFAVGQTVATVTVSVVGDTTFEADETVAVKFSGTKLAADVTATGTITNNDVDTANAATTFALTTGVDTGSSFTGGTGNDTFNGVVGTDMTAANGTTFNAGDALNGGSGTDTLNISISGTNTADRSTAATTLTSIERVSVTNYETSAFNSTLDLAGASGVATLALAGSDAAGDTYFTSVQAIAAAEMSNGSGDLSITYANTAVNGTADTQNLTLSGVTAGTFVVAATTPSSTAGLETLAITSSGSARNVLTAVTDATTMTTITVAGTQALTLGTVGASVETLDASANTGGLTATLNALTNISVTGSTGNDSIQAGAVLGTGSVAAGSGTDTLVLTDDTFLADSVVGGLYTGFETLSRKVSAAGTATGAQDVSLISGITTLNATMIDSADGNAASTDSVTFTNLAATTNTLNITALATAENGDTHDLSATVTASRETDTAAETMTVNLGTSTAASGATAVDTSAGTAQVVLAVTLANEETLTLNSQGGANFISTLTANDLTSLTVTGSKDLSIASIASNSNMATLNAGAFTGALSIAANAGTVASTITGGTGNDSLTGGSGKDSIDGGSGNDSIVGAAGNDTISGGAGADSITAGAGTDSVSGGDGNDTFVVGTTVADFVSGEVVAGGSGTDTLTFGAAAYSFTVADLAGVSGIEKLTFGATTHGTTMTLTDAVYTTNGNAALTITASAATSGATTIAASGLTAANSIVLDMSATNNSGSNNIVLGAGNDTVKVDVDALDNTTTITGGSGTDTLTLTLQTTNSSTTMAAGITGFEVMNIASTSAAIADAYIIVADAAFVTSGATMTVDASNLTTGTMNFSGAAETTGKYSMTGGGGDDTLTGGSGADTISGGSGADSITGGVGIDSLSGGDGDDTFNVATTGTGFTGLASAEVISGGAGNDSLVFAAGAVSIAATDLTNMSGVEIISIANTTETAALTLTDAVFTADGVTTLTVNETAATSGVLTLSASGLSAANSVKLDISATNNSASNNVALGAGNDTVTVDAVALNNTTTIAGGSGTDTLVLKAQTTAPITIDTTVTGFETVTFTDTAGVYNLVTTDGNVASGATMTVNASNNATGTLLWNGAAELDGKFSITGGVGADTLTGGAGVDTISGGSGADSITGGSGADNLTGGAGADAFVYTAVAQSGGSNVDTITDYVTGTDKLAFTLDYSALSTAQTVNATRVSAGVAGVTLAQNALSGERGQYIYDTTNSLLYVNVNNDNLVTSLDYTVGVNAASTASASIVDGDLNFSITGGSGADTITAGGGADTIIGGGAADSITAGTGVDVVKWTATTAATFATETGSTAGTNVTFTAGTIGDKVIGFVSATDKLHFAAAAVTNAIGTEVDTLKSIVKGGTVANTDRFVHITDTAVGDNVNTGAGAVTVLDGLTTTAVAVGDSFIVAMDNDTDTFLYYVKQISVANTIAAQDVTLIGVLSGITAVANGDFVSF